MGIFRLFITVINWFIPDQIKKEGLEALNRGQIAVAFCLLSLPFHLNSIFKYLAINSPLVYFNYSHIALIVILLFLHKFFGLTKLVGSIIIITLFAVIISSTIYVGALNSYVLYIGIVCPVAAVFILGYRVSLTMLFFYIFAIISIFILQFNGIIDTSSASQLSGSRLLIDKYYYLIATMIACTLFVLIFQSTKRHAIRSQIKKEEKIAEVTHDLQDLITEVRQNTSALVTSSEQLSRISGEITRNSDEIILSEKKTSESIEHRAVVTQELSGSLRKISRWMTDLRKQVSQAEEEGRLGSAVVREADEIMDKIEKASKQVVDIAGLISELADQTHLLSLNAAIEADKAGDLGRGFAIVAEEVGSLAENSNLSALSINKAITNSNAIIAEGKTTIHETGRLLEDIIQGIGYLGEQINQMVSKISNEDSDIREIAKGSGRIASLSQTNSLLVTRLSDSIADCNKILSDLNAITRQLEHQIQPEHS